jgi:hypothetical protein
MAPLPVIADTFRCALNWKASAGGTATNVMHFRKSGGSAAGLYTSIDSHVAAGMWGAMPATAFVDNVVITPLDGTTASTTNSTGSPAKWTGGTDGTVVPQVAHILKLTTAKRGRSYRGRLFLPMTSENVIAAGVLQSSVVTSVHAAWVTFLTAVAADGYTLVVASYVHSTAELVTSHTVESALATQRRRQTRLR